MSSQFYTRKKKALNYLLKRVKRGWLRPMPLGLLVRFLCFTRSELQWNSNRDLPMFFVLKAPLCKYEAVSSHIISCNPVHILRPKSTETTTTKRAQCRISNILLHLRRIIYRRIQCHLLQTPVLKELMLWWYFRQ